MIKITTVAAAALLLGSAAPFALSTSAIASEHPVDVTFSGELAAELGLGDDEVVVELPFSLAAEVCPDLAVDATSCDAAVTTEDLEEFLEELDDDDDDDGDDNSARKFAPGQLKEDGESAREYAPGQVKEEGESARDSAPGQQKKSDD